MPTRRLRINAAAVAALVWFASPVQAIKLTAQHLYPGLGDVQFQESFDIGPGVDLAIFHPFAYRNLDADPFLGPPKAGGMVFRVEINSSFSFHDVPGNALRLLDAADDFFPFAVLYEVRSDIPGFDRSRVGFDADSVTMRFAGLTVREGEYVSFGVTALPEPENYTLLGVGLVMVAAAARHRRTRVSH